MGIFAVADGFHPTQHCVYAYLHLGILESAELTQLSVTHLSGSLNNVKPLVKVPNGSSWQL
jgi:hypothetical protein